MYQLALNNKGINKKNVTFSHLMAAFLLIIMGGVSMGIIRTLADTKASVAQPFYFYAVSIAYILVGIIILFITIKFNRQITTQKNKSTVLRIFELLMLSPVLLYCLLKEWYVPAAWAGVGIAGILYAFYYENTAAKPQLVSIQNEGIHLPTTKVNHLKWGQVLRLIIRHNILTIEAVGNKLYQLDLKKDQNLDIEAIELFAANRIKEEKKIIKNDW
jgi:hypothetical protein